MDRALCRTGSGQGIAPLRLLQGLWLLFTDYVVDQKAQLEGVQSAQSAAALQGLEVYITGLAQLQAEVLKHLQVASNPALERP